jgi:hypothetical protein
MKIPDRITSNNEAVGPDLFFEFLTHSISSKTSTRYLQPPSVSGGKNLLMLEQSVSAAVQQRGIDGTPIHQRKLARILFLLLGDQGLKLT